jgi:hypothetical protein
MKRCAFGRFWRYAALAEALTVFVGLAAPLHAADQPFSFTGTVRFVENDRQFNVFAWQGRASQLGACTGVGLVFEGGYVRQADVNLENDRGDSIDFYIEWVRDRETGESNGDYVITGGSGRFADAAGSGSFQAVPILDGGAAVTLEGTVSH